MSDQSILPQLVEIVEVGGYGEANAYLKAGYRLIHIDSKAILRTRPDSKETYIQRRVAFVVGRTADVAHIDVEPYRPPVKAEPAVAS